MKTLIKTFGIHALIGMLTLSSLGIVYAAWNDDVTSSDTLTTDRWNDLVTHVEGIGGGSGKFIDGTDTNDAVYTTGNVGIGTNSPDEVLHVEANTDGKVQARIANTSATSNAYTELRVDSGTVSTYIGSSNSSYSDPIWAGRGFILNNTASGGLNISAGGSGSDIRFYSSGSATSNERMRITSTGSIGVGTITPSAKLDVVGNIESDALQLLNGGSAATPVFTMNGDSDTGLYTPGADSIGVTTNGTARMIFDAAGNVGIGTTSPSAKLDVAGDIRITEKMSGGFEPAQIIHHTNDWLYFRGGSSGSIISDDGGQNTIQVADSGFIKFETNDGTEKVRINSIGNVGIGDSSPNSRMSIEGTGSIWNMQLSNSGGLNWYLGSAGSTWSSGSGKFLISRSTTSVNADLAIDSSGNVGIGTTSPTTKLQVVGGTTALEQESWNTPSYINGYGAYSTSWYIPGYMKDSMGFLRIKGLVKQNTLNTNFGRSYPIFVLPASHCPPDLSEFITPAHGGYAHILIVPATFNSPNHTNCSVYIETITSGIDSWVSLDGIQVPLF